ncbi:lysozyme inhibitor LprI family protein [Shimia biformata]|uniref:lysozyme inhibitor LprI family protein n=1 Tax=Shimia biformata TaxID=1294299 RepID=UPI00194F1213|nr:lysozyme inhibitor LprI family protein [Shimia biformata]
MNRFIIILFAALAAGPAAAQEVVFSPAATEACLDGLSDPALFTTCIGASANQCMEDTQGGWSTVGMSGCYEQERLYWDARLNAAYKEVRAEAKKMDAEMAEIGSSAPKQADALRDMQRAWIAYRDATCDYERSLWGGGTGGGPATVSCHMYMTAEQTRYLETAGFGE